MKKFNVYRVVEEGFTGGGEGTIGELVKNLRGFSIQGSKAVELYTSIKMISFSILSSVLK